MEKNILLLTGSPRKGGNSDLMAEAFMEGARQAGHTVNKFEAAAHRIGFCAACDTCWSKDVPCSFDDDFNHKLYPLLNEAEALVLCFPLYFCTYPAQIKAPIDKLHSVAPYSKHRLSSIREAALLCCAAIADPAFFNGIIENFKTFAAFEGWENRGIVSVPGVQSKGDIHKTDGLTRACKLGREF